MSDSRLRQLERTWVETGAPQDEVPYLQELLRVGEVERSSLELAAHLGHAPAASALGRPLGEPADLAEWVAELQPLGGVSALRRAALAAAAAALEHWGDALQLGETAETWVEARSFVLCPCRPHYPHSPLIGIPPVARHFRLQAALAGIGWPPTCLEVVDESLWRLERAAVATPVAQIEAKIREALVPWVLGRSDPLTAGWATANTELPRATLLRRALQVAPQLQASAPGSRAAWVTLRSGVLDPSFRLKHGAVEAAVERALQFEPVAGDTPELHRFLEFYTHSQRTREGVTHPFPWFFETGWRELG